MLVGLVVEKGTTERDGTSRELMDMSLSESGLGAEEAWKCCDHGAEKNQEDRVIELPESETHIESRK